MEPAPSVEITRLLQAWGAGDAGALERLTPLVYGELRRMARRNVLKEGGERTLQATALVHEAFLRLIDAASIRWQDRAHFFAIAAQIMRRILVDSARARCAAKRGGNRPLTQLDEERIMGQSRDRQLLALDDALQQLGRIEERQAKVIELRFFGGLKVEETAEVLGVSPRSVKRDLMLAKEWLARELGSEGGG